MATFLNTNEPAGEIHVRVRLHHFRPNTPRARSCQCNGTALHPPLSNGHRVMTAAWIHKQSGRLLGAFHGRPAFANSRRTPDAEHGDHAVKTKWTVWAWMQRRWQFVWMALRFSWMRKNFLNLGTMDGNAERTRAASDPKKESPATAPSLRRLDRARL